MKIDSSLFPVFRAVATMLARDGVIHPKEEEWFSWLLSRYELTIEQKEILTFDFKRPPLINQLLEQINVNDRERLIDWLKVAMQIDENSNNSEKVFFAKVLDLLQKNRSATYGSHVELAHAVLDQDARIQFWKDMENYAVRFSERLPWWRRAGLARILYWLIRG